MIGRIRGTLIEKQPPVVLVEAGGVGYEILVPMTSDLPIIYLTLPPVGGRRVNSQL